MADQIGKDSGARGFLEGNACILAATAFWGANIAFTKDLIPEWMSAYGVTFVRLAGGCALFWLASLFMKCRPIARDCWLNIILGGAVGLFSFILLNITAVRFGSAIDISIIMTLPPMFVILIDVVFAHIRPNALEYAGILVSFAGAVIIVLAGPGSSAEGSDYILGDFLAVFSAICYALYLVIMRKPSSLYRPVNILRWVFLFAAIPSLCLVPGMQNERLLHHFQIGPFSEIGYILLFPTFIAYFLVQPAIKLIGAELVSLYQYATPIFAALTAWLIGIEKIVPFQIAAMAVIIFGMILTNIGKKKRAAKEKAN